jgi:SAM-dependent methyltransferase
MTKTAWHNEDTLPSSMLNTRFKSLSESNHFSSLNRCIELAGGSSLIDIGCGAGEVRNTFSQYQYTGADLPHIIENVLLKKNPGTNFIEFDANETDFSFLRDFDVVLMNGFLSEVPEWFMILNKVLANSNRNVIIHRQEVTQNESHIGKYQTYGNLVTEKTIINYNELMNLFKFNGFSVIVETNSFDYQDNNKTFLVRKVDFDD